MKLFTLLLLSTSLAVAQSTPTNTCSTDNTSCAKATQSDSAHIISTAGDASLSPEETASLKQAIAKAQAAHLAAAASDATLQIVQQTIAANHGATAAGPYQIDTDFSTTIEQIPPVAPPPVSVWIKVADEGDIVLIKAGTTVRYGAPAGTVNQAGGPALAADAWTPSVTYDKDLTVTVSNDFFGPDPALSYKKELDMLGTAGGVARTTPQ